MLASAKIRWRQLAPARVSPHRPGEREGPKIGNGELAIGGFATCAPDGSKTKGPRVFGFVPDRRHRPPAARLHRRRHAGRRRVHDRRDETDPGIASTGSSDRHCRFTRPHGKGDGEPVPAFSAVTRPTIMPLPCPHRNRGRPRQPPATASSKRFWPAAAVQRGIRHRPRRFLRLHPGVSGQNDARPAICLPTGHRPWRETGAAQSFPARQASAPVPGMGGGGQEAARTAGRRRIMGGSAFNCARAGGIA